MIKKRVHWPKVKNVCVKSKDSMSPFLGHQCWYFFNDKTPFPGTCCVHADRFFLFITLKEYVPDWSNALCSEKTYNCWKPCFFVEVPQSYLKGCLLGHSLLSVCVHTELCPTLWDPIAFQVPLSVEFSRQEYWSRLPFPSPGGLPNLGIEPKVSCISCIGKWVLGSNETWLYPY